MKRNRKTKAGDYLRVPFLFLLTCFLTWETSWVSAPPDGVDRLLNQESGLHHIAAGAFLVQSSRTEESERVVHDSGDSTAISVGQTNVWGLRGRCLFSKMLRSYAPYARLSLDILASSIKSQGPPLVA